MSLATVDDLRRRTDNVLLGFLRDERENLEADAHPLLDELAAIVRAGGKRLRPRFCYWGFRAAGGRDGPEIIRTGAALELLHTFAMIFDDVMDASPLRRNRRASFQGMGTPAALLGGLLGFVLADRLLWTSGFSADRLAAMTQRYDRMRTSAIAGQYMDVLAARRGSADEATVRRIGSLKSGAYSVVDPLAIGALAADAPADALAAYGSPVGEAFQIADDVLGVFGDPGVTGKDRDGDLREGKQTVLLARARAAASPQELAFIDANVGRKDLEDATAERVRSIMRSTGALDETRALVASLREEALGALRAAPVDEDTARALRELAFEATDRDA